MAIRWNETAMLIINTALYFLSVRTWQTTPESKEMIQLNRNE